MERIRQITPQNALRLCVKAKPTDNSELAYIRLNMGGAHAEKADSGLKCLVDGELAQISHMGYYGLSGGRLLIPLHDESFILIDGCDGAESPVCRGFSLLVGYESLRSIA
jgi:hypothetical protein